MVDLRELAVADGGSGRGDVHCGVARDGQREGFAVVGLGRAEGGDDEVGDEGEVRG